MEKLHQIFQYGDYPDQADVTQELLHYHLNTNTPCFTNCAARIRIK